MTPEGIKRQVDLSHAARTWPTPNTRDSASSARETTDPELPMHGGRSLTDEIRRWPTPTESTATPEDVEQALTPKSAGGYGASRDLEALWMTPTARDHKDVAAKESNVPTRGLLGRQALRTDPDGKPTSPRAVLNPRFVEALMGFPIGWTDCRPSGTPSSPWPLRSPSRSSP
jgi:DNA (cytosine-5)-methyltransferase 1